MKTNTLLTLLLAAMVVFVTGCDAGGGWKSKIAGSYKGIIFNGGDEYPATTTFKTDGDKVSGNYSLDVGGMEYTGNLSKFTPAGERSFKSRWHDSVDRRGNFSMTFAPDGSSFKGKWDADDGDGDGEWIGKKTK